MFKPTVTTEIATQSEQEAASSIAVAVSPGRQQYHPSAAKAWVRFNGTGTLAIGASYNVSSVTDNSAGNYTVNFTTNFSSGEFAITTSLGTQADTGRFILIGAATVSACNVRVSNLADNANVDSSLIGVACYGDQ
jgi:hypothetical protein